MKTTQHYLERANERFGLNEVEATRLMKRAGQKGKPVSEMQSREKKFLAAKEEAAGCRPIVYQEKIFIFSPIGDCITVYDTPDWFGKRRLYENKQRIRNAKKYIRYSTTFATGVC